MEPNEVVGVTLAFIASLGGAGVIVWRLSNYIADLWSKKYLESIKMKYQKEIEHYRYQLDLIKESSKRYSAQQFELYNNLWKSLYALKRNADLLWEEPIPKNLMNYSHQLEKTIDEIEKSYLLIEDKHYYDLHRMLDEFSYYEIGKTKLVELHRTNKEIRPEEVTYWTNHNFEKKTSYEGLLEDIKKELKSQMRS
jgi:hypothetical protein